MNCEQAKQSCGQVQTVLLAYLDGEVTPSERTLSLAHLSGCTVCQQELDLLSIARSRVRSALQRRAIQAVPSREAWNRLEARLPKVQVPFLPESAQPSPNAQRAAWLSRKASSASRASNQLFGGVRMQKRWIFSGLAGVIALSVLAILVAQTATPVSAARQILDRAYEVQWQQAALNGIQHMSIEIYTNIEALPEDQGMNTTVESYFDLQNDNFRLVTTDNATGQVLEVYAYDGSNAYNSASTKDGTQTDGPLTIYRSPQNQPDNEQFFYRATYTKGEDYFMIRTWGEEIKDASWADEHYTTASGLVLHFIVEPGVTRSGGQFTSALMETPEGLTFSINSTLPRETIKALAEKLVLVR